MTKNFVWSSGLGALALVASCAASRQQTDSEAVLYSDRMSTWFEGAWPDVRVSADEQWAAFGTRHQLALVEIATGRADDRDLDGLRALAFRGNELLRQDGAGRWEDEALPDSVVPRWSPDGDAFAFYRADSVTVHEGDSEQSNVLPGTVTALEWSPGADALFVLSHDASGVSTLSRLETTTGVTQTVAQKLDAPRRAHSIGVSPDGRVVYLPLASPTAPDADSRHYPTVDRDLDIYALDVTDGILDVAVATPQEEYSVTVVGDHLYWTRSLHHQSIVAIPASGGEAHLVAEGGQISYWHPAGNQIAYTVGDLRSADSPLNFDIDVIDVDRDARPMSEPRALIRGYHEDFTPAWSPDGNWLAYHSHRSPTAVPSYMSDGVTDDVYLLRAGESTENEIRLTDFGWEVGMEEWSPDGKRLLFATWDREGAPGISSPWIATLDLEAGVATSIERVPFPEPLRSARMLAWSPVADEIAIENDDEDGTQSLWILSLETSRADKLAEIDCLTYCGIDWTPDGQSVVYSALDGATMQLFAISRSGGEPTRLTNDSGSVLLPQVSNDGRWITATRIVLTRELLRRKL